MGKGKEWPVVGISLSIHKTCQNIQPLYNWSNKSYSAQSSSLITVFFITQQTTVKKPLSIHNLLHGSMLGSYHLNVITLTNYISAFRSHTIMHKLNQSDQRDSPIFSATCTLLYLFTKNSVYNNQLHSVTHSQRSQKYFNFQQTTWRCKTSKQFFFKF